MITRKEWSLAAIIAAITIIGFYTLTGGPLPAFAVPPVTQAFTQCDPSNNGQCWQITNGSGGIAPYPASAIPIENSSGIVSNANAVATLPGIAGKITYIVGYRCSNNGATSATVVNVQVTGLSSPFNDLVNVPAIGGAAIGTLAAALNIAIPASAPNTPIVVTMPALGTGNTQAECHAWGFQF